MGNAPPLTPHPPPQMTCLQSSIFALAVNIMIFTFLEYNTKFATNGDDGACNPVTSATSIVIKWNATNAYHWIRVVFKSQGQFHNFRIGLNGVLNCTNKRLSCGRVYSRCLQHYLSPLTQLELYGTAVDNVCSIYVMYDCNFTLKQQALQSSKFPYSNPSEEARASNAIDGSTNQSHLIFMCPHLIHYPHQKQ